MTTIASINALIVVLTNTVFNVNPTLAILGEETENLWTSKTGSDRAVRLPSFRQDLFRSSGRIVDWRKRLPYTVFRPLTQTGINWHRLLETVTEKPVLVNRSGRLRSDSDRVLFEGDSKSKSEIKCDEYGEAVAKKLWALPLLPGSRPEVISPSKGGERCGGLHTPLIVGGSKAQPGEFPHMVALGWKSDGKIDYLCGGTLISELWVVTAAHCTHSHSGTPVVVRIGTNLLSNNESGEVIGIDQIQRHPTYQPPAMYADIALIKLDRAVAFDTRVRPACLHPDYDVTPTRVWVTGWGVTQVGEEHSDELLKARLDVISNVGCALRHNRSASVPHGVVPSMLCAADVDGNWKTDTCQGDSGGPLQIVHPTASCLYQLVGITSFGKLCALRDYPGVYTRVSHYRRWIERIVWPDEAL